MQPQYYLRNPHHPAEAPQYAAPQDPISMALAAAAAAAGTVGTSIAMGVAINWAVVGISAVIAATAAGASTLLMKASQPSAKQTLQDRKATIRQAIAPRQIVYGQVRVGGTIVFMQSTDQNKYLHMVVALAGHEVAEIGDIYFNDLKVPLDSNGYVTEGFYYNVGSHLSAAEKPRARVKKYLGGPGQVADADLIAASGGKWTSAHVGNGVAYLYVRLTWDSTAYAAGIPQISAVVKGRKVHDPRTNTTAWSNNAALCIRDYLLTPVKDGGVGAQSTELDATNWIAAANLCDEVVPIAGTGLTEKRYALNGNIALAAGNTPKATIESMLTSCAGTLVYAGGKWRLLAAAYRSPTVTLTESDLRGPIQVQTRLSRRDIFNGVKGIYVSPENKWQPADYPALTSDTAQAEDGGERIFRELDRPFTTSTAMAQRLAKVALLKTRQPITVNLPCKLSAFRVQVGDVVNVTNTRFGWAAKPFEVVEWNFSVSGDGMLGVDLSLRETAASIYDWNTSEEQTVDPAPNTLLPDWRNVAAPTNLAVNSANSEVITGTDGSLISRVMVSWTASTDAFVSRYEVQYRIVGQTEWTYRSETTATTFVIDNIPVGTAIDVQVRAANSLGNYSNFVTIFGHTVTGYSTRANPAVTGLKVVGSAGGAPGVFNTRDVSFSWNEHSIGILFDAYVVEIRNAGTNALRRTFTTKTAGFLYDLASNTVDGLSRTFIVSVQVRTILGALSTATTLTATNAAPALPTGITLEGDFRTARLRYTPPAEEDWAGIIVWASTTAGFTPSDANRVYIGPDTLVVWGAAPGTTFRVRYACYDVFGTTGLNMSGESIISTTKISHADLMLEVIDSTSLFPDLQSRINLIDAPGTGLVTKVTQLASQQGTNTAAVETAMSAIDGLEAKYTVKVDVNGYVAGYGIAASANNGTPTSDFIVSADRFSIAKPGSALSGPVIPFIVKTIGSTPLLSFQGSAQISKLETGTLDTELLYVGGANVVIDGPSRAFRVNDGTRDRVRIGKQLDNSYGISIVDAGGNTILSSGSGLGAGVVGSANLAAGAGVNQLYNSDFQYNTDGWTGGDNSTGQTISLGRNLNGTNTIPGLGLAFISIPGTAANGTAFTAASAGQAGQRYPAIAGRRYEASAYVGMYRAAYVCVAVRFYNSAGTILGTSLGNQVTNTTQFTQLSHLARSTVFAAAPTGTTSMAVHIWVQCNGSGGNPTGVWTQAYLGESGANQTEASAWVPGPTPLGTSGVSGLGALAIKNSVAAGTSEVTGLGALATEVNMATARNTLGLGSLATLDTVDWTSVSGKTGFAALSQLTKANASTFIANAALNSAHIETLTADRLASGTILADTNINVGASVRILGDPGAIQVLDPRYSPARERVYIGHRVGDDYGFYLWDEVGNPIFNSSGLNGTFIQNLTVSNAKIANLAVNGAKIEDLSASNSIGSNGTNVSQLGVSMTCTGKQVTVVAAVYQTIPPGSGGSAHAFNLVSSSVTLKSGIQCSWVDASGGVSTGFAVHTFTPAAGSQNFFITGLAAAAGNTCSIWVIENRK